MINSYKDDDFERAQKLVYDESNVTETNPLSDFFKIIVKVVLVICLLYFSLFLLLTIVIKNLSIENQIKLENALSTQLRNENVLQVDDMRLQKVKSNILSVDKNFPKTSNLDIRIIDKDYLNAFCAPNGNIYITKKLYDKLKSDGELTFVIAHEMSHYKTKDHLMQLRSNLASSVVVFVVSVFTSNSGNDLSSIVSSTIDLSDLKYSRSVEAKCDKYAAKVVKLLYGSVDPAVNALELLKDNHVTDFTIEFLSTHPELDKRIEKIKHL